MAGKGVGIGGLCLQWDRFGRKLDVKLMFRTIALAAKASTGTVLTLWFGFVALLLAPSTCTREKCVSAQTWSWSSLFTYWQPVFVLCENRRRAGPFLPLIESPCISDSSSLGKSMSI
jgi:hypothetical protein